MNKIAILTLNGYFNYGNRLQNYALQNTIEKLGYKCETIRNATYINKGEFNKAKSGKQIFWEKSFLEKVVMIKYKLNNKKIRKISMEREAIFKEFSKEHINETEYTIELGEIPNDINQKYDYFIAGSDQVWNPNDPMVSEINFMTFADKSKRLTYAPSFGVSKIPQRYKDEYMEFLNGLENISVREYEGAKIIKELTGKNAQVVLDPTMLLDKSEWLKISKSDKNKPKGKYILTYFLGGVSSDTKKKINKIAKENKFEIVNLSTLKDMKHYASGPSEFIDYINDASVFFTDSFHGCVFSLLMETPFVVYDRNGHTSEEKMNSRIDTFLKKFDLEERRARLISKECILKFDYNNAYNILKNERKKSIEYLKESIV
ncbi:polysaccharide pyruvyl transferase family protein [Clostridium perfringens]|uniref:polysaccharide pyruvyl transferase family protein n=1 Tax=Clostridium perfringens TaxID=1502 RepID=UPI001A2AD0DF|nr:polysaccharide pyruvyl transferase family protein [Clostridium perfringens]HAT4073161.1 polysaccharide pyruvyl transferase family protein [Clostridium perfringens]